MGWVRGGGGAVEGGGDGLLQEVPRTKATASTPPAILSLSRKILLFSIILFLYKRVYRWNEMLLGCCLHSYNDFIFNVRFEV